MILQQWINGKDNNLMVVERFRSAETSPTGCIFLPGLGQTKAGLYFLYTMIAERIYCDIPTLQVDYSGFGDSEGNLYECTIESILNDIKRVIRYFKNKYKVKKIFFVSSGFANSLILDFVVNNTECDYELILIKPFLDGILYEKYKDNIDMNYLSTNALIDTAFLVDWDADEELFKWLGAGRNRTKGLLVRQDFFLDIIKSSIKDNIQLCNKKMLIISNEKNEFLISGFGNNVEWFFTKKEDPNILSMLERKQVINKIVDWILNRIDLDE